MAAARPIRLVTGFVTVGFWTLLSRVLGFVRDIMIAAYIGTGPVAEAFLVAFSLPNMFRRFFAEGAFNTAFVPMFSKKLEAGEDAEGFARDALSGLASLLVVLTVAAIVFMPALVLAMAAGFAGDVRFELAVDFGRIAFAYILFISVAALLSGVLNASGRFAAAAAAPLLLNVVLVAALVAAERGAFPGIAIDISSVDSAEGLLVRHGTLLTWGVLVAGAAQMALVWVAAARAGFRLVPRLPRLTPDMRRLAMIAGPAMLAGGVVQINLLVGRQVGSFFEGAIAWLSFADRLYQLPLGVVGIAVGVVLLPDLARRLRAGDGAGGREALSRAGEISMALTIPSAVALVVIPVPIVSVLFERGEFGADDTAATALALAVYGAGLPAFVLQKVLQPLYFAREDTRTPFRYALVAMVVNAVAAIGFAWTLGFVGAAIGTTLAAWAMVWLLHRGRRGMGEVATFDDRFRRRIWRILAASALMGAGLWLGVVLLGPLLGVPTWRYLALGVLIAGGMALYAGLGQLLGAFRLGEFRRALRRG
ncbi:murein biosynthesis integral membrane protein MurJ [Roseibacterium sp. SDUM158017]|uniref:murein biosynthesis integral membrane protein MurJ n=1 Tax=Roseicyclus salinarum TaxID=3036773 RepID=UPI002414E258|nr:murein biosynthesis integral membrane protein MurJ [Roseibacterium sp. SDUM158017]MDG4647218.1 murein biosynthesis integral membrane protein MurJ [Roseibacterium sp. SDUM158017]